MKTQNPITYCLKDGSHDSEKYYRDISLFTYEAMQLCEEHASDLVEEYMNFLKERTPGYNMPNRKEYLFEVLMMGVYMREYGGFAKGSPYALMVFMKGLGKLWGKGKLMKRYADRLRGLLGLPVLMREKNRERFLFPSAANFSRLILWLEATAEFNPQTGRMKAWNDFLKSLPAIQSSIYLSIALQLADCFKSMAARDLGRYTSSVDAFVDNARTTYKTREDGISVHKTAVEYHLNMVGAVVMNEVFLNRFLRTRERVLLLPPCLRKSVKCRSVKGPKGDACVGCEESCAVNRLRILGMQQNFEVVIMHHASKPPDWLKNPEKNKHTGIVGVACPTNLISGGWAIEALGVPAQCVVLDHCGCRHWHSEGVITSVNEKELLRKVSGNEPGQILRQVRCRRNSLALAHAI